MKGSKGNNNIVILALAVFAILAVTGIINVNIGQTQSALNGGGGNGGTGGSGQGGVGYATTLSAGAIDALTGGQEDVNGQAYASDGTWYSAEAGVMANPTTVSAAAPNSLTGYLMIGNDNGQSGTDQGAEVYYRKVAFSYSGKGAFNVPDTDGSNTVKLYNESTVTWTGYDDGTAEAATNISVGSGATVLSTEIKISSATGLAVGNSDFANPIGVCFNTSTNSEWDEVKPLNHVGTFESCDAFSSRNMLGDCYILPTGALKDGAEYRFYVKLDAASGQNPDSNDYVNVFLLDKTYYQDDNGNWQSGWCDDSVLGTDRDPGIAAITNEKVISIADA